MNWYLAALKKYAVFTGRSRRKEYWSFFLINVLIAMVLGFISGATGAVDEFGDSAISTIFTLVIFVPSVAVGVRRMHDIGRSGWWIILPIVNLIFCLLDSQPGVNKYGPNPKEGVA